jgi:hypothetical protein
VQVFELFETKFFLQGTQDSASERVLLSLQLVQLPEYLVQLAQLTPHERQVLLMLFKYVPAKQTASAWHFLLVVL